MCNKLNAFVSVRCYFLPIVPTDLSSLNSFFFKIITELNTFFFLSIKSNILEFFSCSSISFKSSLWTEFRMDWYKMHPWCFATEKFSKKCQEKKILGKCHEKKPQKIESSIQIVAHCYLLRNNCLNLLHRCSSTVSDIFFCYSLLNIVTLFRFNKFEQKHKRSLR